MNEKKGVSIAWISGFHLEGMDKGPGEKKKWGDV